MPATVNATLRPSGDGGRHGRWPEVLTWALLAGLLVVGLPLFVCMPVWVDGTFYDLGARSLLRKGALYRDVFYHGLPGMFFLQAGARSALGWGCVSLRCVDLLFVAASVFLLADWPPRGSQTRAARVGTAAVLFFCYLGTSEWCHCQPDTWMLLPVLGALSLRRRQLADLRRPAVRPNRVFVLRGLAEGLCWGVAFLIKPFAAVPGLACLLLAAGLGRGRGRLLALDLGLVLTGGLLVGGALVGWLCLSGDWPHFLAVSQGGWRADYLTKTPGWREHCARALFWMLPWSGLHLVAIPLALAAIAQAWKTGARREDDPERGGAQALLAACYLGWFVQANFLQLQFPYHLVAPLLLGLALLAGQSWRLVPGWARGPVLAGFLIWASVPHACRGYGGEWLTRPHPLFQGDRLAQWGRCWREGSSPDVRDRLTLEPPNNVVAPCWKDLHLMEEELRRRGVGDRELTCSSLSALRLYVDLGVEPSTRFAELPACLILFPAHRNEILAELYASPQRYVVSDLCDLGLTPRQARGRVVLGANLRRSYPWSEPIVFRAGRYLLHRARRPDDAPSAPAAASAPAGARPLPATGRLLRR